VSSSPKARSCDIKAGSCSSGCRVRLAFLDLGEGGRLKVGEVGTAGEKSGLVMLDINCSWGGSGAESGMLDFRVSRRLSTSGCFPFETEKYAFGEDASAGETGLITSAIDTGTPSTVGDVQEVSTVKPEAFDEFDNTESSVEVSDVWEALEPGMETNLACGCFAVSTTNSSFSPRPNMPYTFTSPACMPNTALVPA
jgi:hypothetical protein